MGCKASKSAEAGVTTNPTDDAAAAAAAANPPGAIGKKGSVGSSSNNRSSKRKNKKSGSSNNNNSNKQPSSSFSPTKLNSGSGSGSSNNKKFLSPQRPKSRGGSGSQQREESKVYRLLLTASAASSAGGVSASKSQDTGGGSNTPTTSSKKNKKKRGDKNNIKKNNSNENTNDLEKIAAMCTAKQAAYQNPTTGYTPLHLACRLLLNSNTANGKDENDANNNDNNDETVAAVDGSSTNNNATTTNSMVPSLVERLLQLYPDAVRIRDKSGHVPLHYAIAPPLPVRQQQQQSSSSASSPPQIQNWRIRTAVVKLLLVADLASSQQYLLQTNVKFDDTYDDNCCAGATSTDDEVNNHDGDNNNNTTAAGNTDSSSSSTGGCSPLYHVIEMLPDDFDPHGPTVEHLNMLRNCLTTKSPKNDSSSPTSYVVVSQPNAGDGDQPLALLYRRFTRQFDLAEKFFDGDNSRPEVVKHRLKYKTAAGNTWRMIELLLRPDRPSQRWRIVHRAVQVETPPDLLRYIVETNAEDLTVPDDAGNLPLHYAASSKPSTLRHNHHHGGHRHHHHCYNTYTKYVMDELLYKFPEAASIPNSDGYFALYLAVQAGKPWIGGGIKSLYEAYPPALKQIDLKEHPNLQRALRADGILEEDGTMSSIGLDESSTNDDDDNESEGVEQMAADDELDKEEKVDNPSTPNAASNLPGTSPRPPRKDKVIRDEPHDAIMRIQQDDVDVSEIVTNMWAHEEDPGVQMLGCVAVSKLVLKKMKQTSSSDDPADTDIDGEILRIALSAVAGVVNAMKAHPNEVIVQEKACEALLLLAPSDGQREVSFVASGAVSAIVGAMQAHVSDPAVQEQACGAVAAIIKYGGGERATIVASVSGLTAILNAIAAHPDVVGVQKQGCRALMELTEYSSSAAGADHSASSANLPELPRSQTEPLIEAAKERFPNECGRDADTILSRLT